MVGRPNILIKIEISFGWITMKFCTDIHVAKRMNEFWRLNLTKFDHFTLLTTCFATLSQHYKGPVRLPLVLSNVHIMLFWKSLANDLFCHSGVRTCWQKTGVWLLNHCSLLTPLVTKRRWWGPLQAYEAAKAPHSEQYSHSNPFKS